MKEDLDRINQEWLALNAIRGATKLAYYGQPGASTYRKSFELGEQLYPELLGTEESLLYRHYENPLTVEYKQRAQAQSLLDEREITAHELVYRDITESQRLLNVAEPNEEYQTDQIKRRIRRLQNIEKDLSPLHKHSEHQVIYRDAYNAERKALSTMFGHGFKQYEIGDNKSMRIRVLHPDKPEHITGADIIYERHDPLLETMSFILVQYKMWDNESLYIGDSRLQYQLKKMEYFTCENGVCTCNDKNSRFRFPHCSSFIRPTKRLQRVDQKLISHGLHIPICELENYTTETKKKKPVIRREHIEHVGLHADLFEDLFTNGKIGSRSLTEKEIKPLYDSAFITDATDRVVVHVQEF